MIDDQNYPSNVHQWFGLSYSAYFVMPRMAMSAMPPEWQRRFIRLMEEVEEANIQTPTYHVLRADVEYTSVVKYDSEDENSRDWEFTAVRTDPWANYKYPDYSLLPEGSNPNGLTSSENPD